MFNVNGFKAILIQNNRGESDYYDDQDKREVKIKLCPYNADMSVKFGINTIPEAKGYFIVKSKTPIKEGDQIIFEGRTLSVIEVRDEWIWNKLANIIIAVK
ncbi:MAG: hypothetical protein U0K80_03340 [Methanobrevibacter sp.]|nr:hypothetical protein [Methanobrevibacter sp.]